MHARRDRGAVRMPEWEVVLTGSVLVAFAAFFAVAVWRELPRKRPRVTPSVNPRRSSMDAPEVRSAVDSPLEESGFEPLVPLQNRHNRGICHMSPTASIRVAC